MGTKPPLVVELFGQPGAGKTTLAYAAMAGSEFFSRSSLGAAWERQPKLVKATFVARALLDVPCLAHAAKFVIGARLFRSNSLARLFRLLIKSHWIRSQPGPLLLSEGHLQDLWSILYSSGRNEPDARQLAPLTRRLFRGLDAQIVYLELDPQSAFERIRARQGGKSRLDRLAQEELREQISAHAQLPAKLVEAARLAGLRVQHLDASLPIETTVGQLRSVMQLLVSSVTDRG